MSIEMVAALGSAIGGLISFFLGCSVGRWAKSRAFRSSLLERDVQRIVLNPSSDSPRTFVSESENAKLREENSMLRKYASKALSAISYCCDCCPYVDCGCDTETVPMHEGCKAFEELRELGVEVE